MSRKIVLVIVVCVLCILAYSERAAITSVSGSRCLTEAASRLLILLKIENRKRWLDACESAFPVPLLYMRASVAGARKVMPRIRRERHGKRTNHNSPIVDKVHVSTGLSARRYNALFFARQALLHTGMHYNSRFRCSFGDTLGQCIPILLHISLLPHTKAIEPIEIKPTEQVQIKEVKCKKCKEMYSHSRYIGLCTKCGDRLMTKCHESGGCRKKRICIFI